MATGKHNNKSSRKDIRFPTDLIEQIEKQALKNNEAFSAWVKEACKQRLERDSE